MSPILRPVVATRQGVSVLDPCVVEVGETSPQNSGTIDFRRGEKPGWKSDNSARLVLGAPRDVVIGMECSSVINQQRRSSAKKPDAGESNIDC